MNALRRLLALPDSERDGLGVRFTPAEICQQPSTWAKIPELLRTRRDDLRRFLETAGLRGEGDSTLILAGAGSSEFVGTAVYNHLQQRLDQETFSIPTTHLVTHASATLVARRRYVLLSFARSGNSPESLAAFQFVRRARPETAHLVITCNVQGALAVGGTADPNSFALVLPEETNDRSLVMTSSFSTMALTALGLGWLDDLDTFAGICARLGRAANRVFDVYADLLRDFATLPFSRACYLGSDGLFGTMQECQLKMQEMTDGTVATRFESFLGVRHGPQVFINSECAVVAAISSDPKVRRYELDLLQELKRKGQGAAVLVICDQACERVRETASHVVELFPAEAPVPDAFRVMTDVAVGQLLGMFKSLDCGLKPDSPSASGVINRVVQGVTIYE